MKRKNAPEKQVWFGLNDLVVPLKFLGIRHFQSSEENAINISKDMTFPRGKENSEQINKYGSFALVKLNDSGLYD